MHLCNRGKRTVGVAVHIIVFTVQWNSSSQSKVSYLFIYLFIESLIIASSTAHLPQGFLLTSVMMFHKAIRLRGPRHLIITMMNIF